MSWIDEASARNNLSNLIFTPLRTVTIATSTPEMSPSPVVLIIGCGIAGPVLGYLLKQKGYTPIVFEKVSELGDAGASLMLMSNG